MAVLAKRTRAKHGLWDEAVQLVPVQLVDRLQRSGCLVIVLPSMADNADTWAGLDIPALAGIVIYSVEDGANAAGGSFRASVDECPLPVLRISGDGSLDERRFGVFVSQVARA